ncbi:hypothetical protein EYF80_047593 [Liparis tanakae]|uniref:Uncharacterized protein n=1 Tax=Liparis tanakae TaxID=230148 RepID=A0A4Z2FNB0_9TELE|nr:hypothetical protein EYF80_047593 [Liparis tanakae]
MAKSQNESCTPGCLQHVTGTRLPPDCTADGLGCGDGWTYQFRSLMRVKPSFSWISCGFMASGRSCLLANIKMMASRISRSLMMRWSSCLASSMRSRKHDSVKSI